MENFIRYVIPLYLAGVSLLHILQNLVYLRGKTLILWADEGNLVCVRTTVQKLGFNPDYQDTIDGNTALMAAALAGNTEIVKVLLEAGADPDTKNKDGKTVIILAAKKCKRQVEAIIIKHKIKQFLIASKEGELDNIKSLLNREIINSTIKGLKGFSALHLASDESHIEVVKYLLNNGADINKESSTGITPLHLAIKKGHSEVVKELLDRDANIGVTQLEMAIEKGNQDVLDMLAKHFLSPKGMEFIEKEIESKNSDILNGIQKIRRPYIRKIQDYKTEKTKPNGEVLLIFKTNKAKKPFEEDLKKQKRSSSVLIKDKDEIIIKMGSNRLKKDIDYKFIQSRGNLGRLEILLPQNNVTRSNKQQGKNQEKPTNSSVVGSSSGDDLRLAIDASYDTHMEENIRRLKE